MIPERLREPKAHYPIRFTRQTENELQLVLELKAILEGGEKRNLKILIDTGPEANLIRTGLVPKNTPALHTKSWSWSPSMARFCRGERPQQT